MRVAITGATGFIGRSLIRQLLARGHTVSALVRKRQSTASAPGLTLVHGDLARPERLRTLVADADAVIHLAGAIGGRRRADFTAVNVDGTAALLAAVTAAAPQAFFLHVSSLAAREPQLSWYASSKRDGEVLVERAALRWMIVRPPAVYGAHDPALAALWRALARGFLLCPADPDARFALTFVDDLVRTLVAVVEQRPDERRILTVADARPAGYSWREVAAIAAQVRGAPVRIIRVPRGLLMAVAMLTLSAAWMLGRRPVLVPGKVRELAHRDWVCDNTLAALLEGVKPGRCLPETLAGLPGWQDQAGAKT